MLIILIKTKRTKGKIMHRAIVITDRIKLAKKK